MTHVLLNFSCFEVDDRFVYSCAGTKLRATNCQLHEQSTIKNNNDGVSVSSAAYLLGYCMANIWVKDTGTLYLVPGTWYLVPVPGTWYLVPEYFKSSLRLKVCRSFKEILMISIFYIFLLPLSEPEPPEWNIVRHGAVRTVSLVGGAAGFRSRLRVFFPQLRIQRIFLMFLKFCLNC